MNHHTRATRETELATIHPGDTGSVKNEKDVAAETENNLKRLYDQHYLMYAEDRRALLIVLQGIDTSGKDGTTRHLAAGLNPQGLKVHSFKQPSDNELDHDYLWRIHNVAPGRGEVAIFNRSHYEEVAVVKVHPELLKHQDLPPEILNDPHLFEKRYRQINDFERMLTENGIIILKFLLHISKEEQMERFQKRLTDPRKNWKFSENDLAERKFWDNYMEVFQDILHETSTEHAPWYVVPADKKWYRNYLIGKIVVETLDKYDMKFPTL